MIKIQLRGSDFFLGLHQVRQNLGSLPIVDVHQTDVRFGCYHKLLEHLVVFNTYRRVIFDFDSISIDFNFILEFEPMESDFCSAKEFRVYIQKGVDWLTTIFYYTYVDLPFKMDCLHAI